MRQITDTMTVQLFNVVLQPNECALVLNGNKVIYTIVKGAHYIPTQYRVLAGTKAELEQHIASERLDTGDVMRIRTHERRNLWGETTADAKHQ